MQSWRLSLFSLFILFGLVFSRLVLIQEKPKPAILADVTNSATIATPTPTTITTSTPTPTATSTLTPTPTFRITPTATPTGVATPTGTITPTPTTTIAPTLTVILSPTPTLIAQTSPIPAIPPTPEPTEEPEQYFSYSLFGYTSSYANVRLEGIKLLEGTKANKDGYFEFINFKASNRNLEFCLLSIDTENLISPPLCVPVPSAEANRSYGPYLLPPTVRLTKGDIQAGEQSQLSGKTIPGASVNINVFDQEEKPLGMMIKPVFAASKPTIIKLGTNSDGSFSTNLSGQNSGKKRVFAQSAFKYNDNLNQTPKSVTLTLNILSLFLALLIQFISLFRSLLNLNFILFCQLLLVVYLLLKRKQLFNWYYLYRHKKTAIVLYRQQKMVRAIKNYCPL